MPQPPPNAFQPGKRLTVGSHRISILKYISEGGFAHVYTCKIDPPFHNNTTACLKRVVVPNKEQLTLLRQEVDAMKRLRGNGRIVSYIDSHALRLPGNIEPQQYEVLLLMEYCSGNGLIDFMNTRLTNRLTEPEILQIVSDVTIGVGMCHHLSPPLLHRDIKIENVLIDHKGTYKLCDFGSAVGYSKVPKTALELHTLHVDIMHHTTPQYRAPEMLDLSRGFPIDDKLDVWALGCFLYKLCYYTTPFELPTQKTLQDLEQLILKCLATLRFPGSPQYSPRLQNVIRCCLREDPRRRPNAVQLLQEISLMQGKTEIPDVIPYSVKLVKPVLAEVPVSNVPLKTSMSQDAFSTIDKSKALSMGRPKSTHVSELKRTSDSSASLHDLIKQHVSETNSELTQFRKSEDLDRGTLDFLRSKGDGVGSRQNTGGSLKASLKNGLRKISTGGSISAQRSGSLQVNKRSTSVKQLFTGGRKPSDSAEPEYLRVPPTEPKKTSIQKRMSLLLSNKNKKAPKSALGYGKYTDQDDISAINFTDLSSSSSADSFVKGPSPVETFEFSEDKLTKRFEKPRTDALKIKAMSVPPESNIVKPASNVVKATVKTAVQPAKPPLAKYGAKHFDTPPPCPPSLSGASPLTSRKKAPPPKPKKPLHLKKHDDQRRLSASSEVSVPDLDDLEKQFAKRFPSYV